MVAAVPNGPGWAPPGASRCIEAGITKRRMTKANCRSPKRFGHRSPAIKTQVKDSEPLTRIHADQPILNEQYVELQQAPTGPQGWPGSLAGSYPNPGGLGCLISDPGSRPLNTSRPRLSIQGALNRKTIALAHRHGTPRSAPSWCSRRLRPHPNRMEPSRVPPIIGVLPKGSASSATRVAAICLGSSQFPVGKIHVSRCEGARRSARRSKLAGEVEVDDLVLERFFLDHYRPSRSTPLPSTSAPRPPVQCSCSLGWIARELEAPAHLVDDFFFLQLINQFFPSLHTCSSQE